MLELLQFRHSPYNEKVRWALDQSALIIDWLEAKHPEVALLPQDAALREEALQIQSRFDEDLTPRMRRTVLDALLRQPGYFARVFADGGSAMRRLAYACTVPLAAPLVRKGNGIAGPETLADGHRAATEAFDFVARSSAATGYLCGGSFTLADLTAAASLAMLVRPPESPMHCPQPVGRDFAALVARYAQHPGAHWVRHIYANHRGSRSDFDGLSTAAR